MASTTDYIKRILALTPYEVRRRSLDASTRDRAGYEYGAAASRAIARVRSRTMVAHEGLVTLYQQVAYLERNGIEGALVECGVWKGGAATIMAIANLEQGSRHRSLHLFDSFEGIPEPDATLDGERACRDAGLDPGEARGRLRVANDYSARGGPGSVEEVARGLIDVGYPRSAVTFHKGWFQETVHAQAEAVGPIALLRLDGDWYDSTRVCLDALYPNVVAGGFVVIDDYGAYEGCRRAVDEYLAEHSPRPYLSHVNADIRYLIRS